MSKSTDVSCRSAAVWFLPVHTRMPLKFGGETVTYVTCARAKVGVANAAGETAEGWGETPLSVTWVWPGGLSYEERHEAMKSFCVKLAEAWAEFEHRSLIRHQINGLADVIHFNPVFRHHMAEFPLVCRCPFLHGALEI